MIWESRDGKDDAATVVNVEPFKDFLPFHTFKIVFK